MSKSRSGKPSFWQQAIMFTFFLGIGAACGYLTARYAADSGMSILPMLALTLVCIYVTQFVQTLVHEAGHLVFGLLTGYGFCSFRIGSFILLRREGRLVFKRLSLAGTGGQCLLTPPEWHEGKANSFPFVLYNLGGVLMNLIFSALCLLLALSLHGAPWAALVLWVFAILGVTFALINGVPLRTGLVDNDGRNVLSIRQSPDALRAFWVQLKINEANAQGMRLKDMPSEWFALPTDADRNNSLISTLDVLACNRLIDAQDFDAARIRIDALADEAHPLLGLHRRLLLVDRLYLELIGERSAAVIDALCTQEQRKFMKSMRRFPPILRTQYALALLYEHDLPKAEAFLTQFEACAAAHPYPSEIEGERELIARAKSLAAA